MYAKYNTLTDSKLESRQTRGLAARDHSHGRETFLARCSVGTSGMLSVALLTGVATTNWSLSVTQVSVGQQLAIGGATASSKDIAHIRKVMRLSVSELAGIFGVSRQAVHDWINGEALSKRNAERLSELTQAADKFCEAGVEVAPQMLRRKISGGKSLIESFRDGSDAVDMTLKLIETLTREARQRQLLAERLAGREASSLANTDFGSPHLSEES